MDMVYRLLDRLVDVFLRIRGYLLSVDAKRLSMSQIRVKYIVRLYDVDRSDNVPTKQDLINAVSNAVSTQLRLRPSLATMFNESELVNTLSLLYEKLLRDSEKSKFVASALASAREILNVIITVSLLKEIYVHERYDLMPIIEYYDPQLADSVRHWQNVFTTYKMFIPGKISNLWVGDLDVYELVYEGGESRFVLGMDYVLDVDMSEYIDKRLSECRSGLKSRTAISECETYMLQEVQSDIESMVQSFLCMNEDSEDAFKKCIIEKSTIE